VIALADDNSLTVHPDSKLNFTTIRRFEVGQIC